MTLVTPVFDLVFWQPSLFSNVQTSWEKIDKPSTPWSQAGTWRSHKHAGFFCNAFENRPRLSFQGTNMKSETV